MTPPALAEQIIALVRDGGDHNRLVIDAGPFFVVLRAAEGEDAVDVEAAGGRHLPDGWRLDADRVGRLTALGLRQRTAASTFVGTWPLTGPDDARAAADKVSALLGHVYDRPEPPHATLTLGDRAPIDNDRLHQAMTRLSKRRDMAARMTLYNTLVNAPLLVALQAPIADPRRTDRARLHVFEQLSGTDVHGVFTTHEHLRRFAPRELPTVVWTGRVLFPVLAARKTGSVLINPRGDLRGELYRNEILTLAEGIARLDGVH